MKKVYCEDCKYFDDSQHETWGNMICIPPATWHSKDAGTEHKTYVCSDKNANNNCVGYCLGRFPYGK